jgi:hypothetical protein
VVGERLVEARPSGKKQQEARAVPSATSMKAYEIENRPAVIDRPASNPTPSRSPIAA